jgi:hypothetical protein
MLSVCNFLTFIGTVVDSCRGSKNDAAQLLFSTRLLSLAHLKRAGDLQTPADTTVLSQTCLELDSAIARVAVAAHE